MGRLNASRDEAEIVGGRIAIHLMRGDSHDAMLVLKNFIQELRTSTGESGFEEFTSWKQVPLGMARALKLETLNILEDKLGIETLGDLCSFRGQEIASLRGVGPLRLTEIREGRDELLARWKKVSKLRSDRQYRAKKKRQARQEEELRAGYKPGYKHVIPMNIASVIDQAQEPQDATTKTNLP